MEARLAGQTDLAGFREEARLLLAHQIPPDEVQWLAQAQNAEQFTDTAPADNRLSSASKNASSIVPASFQRLCEVVVLHHDPERFSLLYRLLWRLVHEPGLRNSAVDADMVHAQHMGQAVRRDLHKLKAFVRFRTLREGFDAPTKVAWAEPTHHIVEAAAPWFAQRAPNARWAIFTPERCVECDGQQLHFGKGLARNAMPAAAAPDEAWAQAYRDVFGARAAPT
ncbi:MAG: TIGR03915 family putative DNA repair protein, partial [Ramlibacter sp.]|nr:TIGR03915 family putative DNA repair protein [Ramlibacter sp.]